MCTGICNSSAFLYVCLRRGNADRFRFVRRAGRWWVGGVGEGRGWDKM